MTGEIEAQAQTIDYICHCEASKKPWQSVPRAGTALMEPAAKSTDCHVGSASSQ